MTIKPAWAVPLLAGVGLLAVWYIWKDDLTGMAARGGQGRQLAFSGVRAAPLAATMPQIVPDHLHFFGPPVLPPDWVPHRMSYSQVPGKEMQRLMLGGPGAVSPQVPREMRGWMFCPPAEEDY